MTEVLFLTAGPNRLSISEPPCMGRATGLAALAQGQHVCPRCHNGIEGATTRSHINGAQWTDHVLHYCTDPGVQGIRDKIQACCNRWSAYLDIGVSVQSVTELLPKPAYQIPPDEILLDLRGFLATTIRDQGDELNLSPDDLAGLFNDFSSELIQMDRCLDINNTTNQNPEARSYARVSPLQLLILHR